MIAGCQPQTPTGRTECRVGTRTAVGTTHRLGGRTGLQTAQGLAGRLPQQVGGPGEERAEDRGPEVRLRNNLGNTAWASLFHLGSKGHLSLERTWGDPWGGSAVEHLRPAQGMTPGSRDQVRIGLLEGSLRLPLPVSLPLCVCLS